MCRYFDVMRIFFLHNRIWVRNWKLNEALVRRLVRRVVRPRDPRSPLARTRRLQIGPALSSNSRARGRFLSAPLAGARVRLKHRRGPPGPTAASAAPRQPRPHGFGGKILLRHEGRGSRAPRAPHSPACTCTCTACALTLRAAMPPAIRAACSSVVG
jgi:hypothetical protein